ncbi:hypothetical protein D3C76_166350 [compost metagenome]
MKKNKGLKISIMTLLTVFLLSLGSTSAFAAWGWGDTMNTAVNLYNPGDPGNSASYVPIDSPYDDDWYVINNVGSFSDLSFSIILTPPSGIDLNFQIVKTDASGNILSTTVNNFNGPGGVEGRTTGISANQKAYVRVFSQGPSDFDSSRAYSLTFTKQ